ncbi:hypothetical protein B0I72DRAFT_135679 [Yarrowia lipolytica]|uniref:Uncharacterized protein n=1 Tax=Yarrowia lipolytica TaxID=4952 RepID=A0A371CAZ8_YARLL|nr:hypothetical protein B0I71DRAFT_129034 [Yarrowia lipolytica]RDW33818.1 hypothetical protein B0I72DRAFT_135679 [Yarrowia lipolytica]RDW39027.1 hypothetical protein B0I73DRAFT_132750 [Yarrowia lipolytica]
MSDSCATDLTCRLTLMILSPLWLIHPLWLIRPLWLALWWLCHRGFVMVASKGGFRTPTIVYKAVHKVVAVCTVVLGRFCISDRSSCVMSAFTGPSTSTLSTCNQ